MPTSTFDNSSIPQGFLTNLDGTDFSLPDWQSILPSLDFTKLPADFGSLPSLPLLDTAQFHVASLPVFDSFGAFGNFSNDLGLNAKAGNNGSHGGGGGSGGGGGTLLTTYTSGDPNVADSQEFNITINFSGSWTSAQQSIVTRAADLLSKIIVGDVMDDINPYTNLPVDDIVINVSTGRIDGNGNPLTGNVLAQTSITSYRDAGTVDEFLPVSANIKLDSTDLKNSVSGGWFGTWDDIILHEMTHAIGFAGLIFANLNLLDSSGNFIGANALAAYSAGGNIPVPVESGGGSGTAGSHWSETDFAPNGTPMSNELMTGYVAYNEQTYLSDTTVAALADLGYTVLDPSAGIDYLAVNLLA
jgi:hypothetical protein